MSAGAPGTPSLLRHRAGDLFFTNAEGEEVYLAGSHTWTSVQDVDGRAFEWDELLALQKSIGADVTRLWAPTSPTTTASRPHTPSWSAGTGASTSRR